MRLCGGLLQLKRNPWNRIEWNRQSMAVPDTAVRSVNEAALTIVVIGASG